MFNDLRCILLLAVICLFTVAGASAEISPGAEARTIAQDLAKFDKGNPSWKVRMDALVKVVKAGPEAVPLLVKTLQEGSPPKREFAAQALAVLADASSRPALIKALEDRATGVRIYAVRALSRMEPVKLTDQQRKLVEQDARGMRCQHPE